MLVDRNLGSQLHGLLEAIIAAYVQQFRRSHRIRAFTETRLRVDAATGRHRIPDVMVLETPYREARSSLICLPS